jgi:hypothetical protein
VRKKICGAEVEMHTHMMVMAVIPIHLYVVVTVVIGITGASAEQQLPHLFTMRVR